MYYIAGAVMKMISKLETWSANKCTSVLQEIKMSAVSTKVEARNVSLPLAKVELQERVNLYYVKQLFYNLILKVESVFHTLLSKNNVASYGGQVIADIVLVLSKENFGFEEFFSPSHDDEVKSEVTRQILFSYGRIRGINCVWKINGKVGSTHHETLRSALGTASAIAERNEKEGKDETYEQSPRYKFLIRQPKYEIVSMCKARKLHHSGTKKKLAFRIIEYEATIHTVEQPAQRNISCLSIPLAEVTKKEDDHL